MRRVFETSSIGSIRINNRILQSATTDCLADERGRPTEELTRRYVQLAEGGVGAIIVAQAGVQPNGRLPVFRCLMIDRDEVVPDYAKVVDEVHRRDTAIILQIGHAGRQTRSALTGLQTVAPSALRDSYFNEDKPRMLTEPDIEAVVQSFVAAIRRAREAGFDGVQLHAAHGWLLSQFLSPHTNRRRDRWGGSTENRFRILRRIFEGARATVGHYPIIAKINGHEDRKAGIKLSEALQIASLLEDVGCHAIEVSCGVADDGMSSTRVRSYPVDAAMEFSFRLKRVPRVLVRAATPLIPLVKKLHEPIHNYNVPAAREIKRRVSVPVIVVGGIHRLRDIESIIAAQDADYVAMSRPFIIEPDIVDRFRTGTQLESSCISCGYCLASLEAGPLRCYHGKL